MMWKQAFTLCLILWAVSAANNTKYTSEEEQSYSEEYLEDEYVGEDETKSGMPIGQWWKNGKALEPKWRDGDNVPLVPFRAITSNKHRSKEKIELDVEDISPLDINNDKSKTFYSDNVSNQFSGSDVHLSRRRKPPQLPEEEQEDVLKHMKRNNGRRYEEALDSKMQNLSNNKHSRYRQDLLQKEVKFPYENPEVVIKYREAFQNQPNEYELNDEEYQKPRPRKRRPPQNDEFAEARVNYPMYQTMKPITTMTTKTNSNLELKNLLKKQQGNSLSLSEILQRSNFTLADLLQGKVNVIDLLKIKNKDDEIEEIKPIKTGSYPKVELKHREPLTNGKDEVKYKLLEHEIVKVNDNRDNNTNMEVTKVEASGRIIPLKEIELKDQELIDDKKAKMQELMRIIDSKMLMSQKMAISENTARIATTMKNLDTTLSAAIKPTAGEKLDNTEDDEIMEFSDFTMKSSTKEKMDEHNVEPTLSIEQLLTPENDYEEIDSSVSETTTMVIEMETTMSTELKTSQMSTTQESTINHINVTSENEFAEHMAKIEPDARAEILELFSSGASAKRLERLLKSRNMTLDEFIALRQRGSSQVHLAEVSKQRNQKSYNIESPKAQINNIPESTTKMSDLISFTVTTEKAIEVPILEEVKDNIADEQRVTLQETEIRYPQSTSNTDESRDILNIYTAFETIPIGDNIQNENNISVEKNRTMTLIEVGRVEEILNEASGVFDDELIHEESKTEEKMVSFSKITPSIIASGVILGVTLIVFVIILIICRVQQKQKYTYRNTFSRAVFQSPAMAARKLSNSSSLNTIMVNVVTTSNTKKPERPRDMDSEYDVKSDIENDSLDGNDSWDTIPDFMK